MTNATPEVEKLSMANTKKEMLQAYNRLLKQLTEKRRAEMKPADEVAAKKKTEAKAVADSLSTEGIGRQIGVLKSEIGKTLNELADRLEEETSKYAQVKKAVEDAEAELHEIFGIEKAASSLAALLEAQKQEREEFQSEMATTQDDFDNEMKSQREVWEREKAEYEAAVKERKAAEQKQRQREQEEFKYEFDRRKQLALEQYEHEKATREREMEVKREAMEKDLAERENAVAAAEAELSQLRAKVEEHPAALEQAVARAIKETTDRLERERQSQTALLEKESAGERNVLNSRIESLQATVQQQAEQIAKLSQQLEHSYRQVQDIAVKAIEGPSASRSPGRVYPPGAHDLPPQSAQGE